MSIDTPPERIDEAGLRLGASRLAAIDPLLGSLVARNGVPPLWPRDPGFATLVRFVLEQQVSLASAAAAYANLTARLDRVTPEGFLAFDDDELRSIGFSRQKAAYCRGIGRGVIAGTLDLGGLDDQTDEDASSLLRELPGIGPWTAACYLMFVLRRPDVWPPGDRALLVALGEVLGVDPVPTSPEAEQIADRWRPLRSVAARILWHEYLGGRSYHERDGEFVSDQVR